MNSSFGALTVGVLMIGSTATKYVETLIAVFVVRLTQCRSAASGGCFISNQIDVLRPLVSCSGC